MDDDLEKAYYLNIEHAKNAKHKFNYFFVGLNFSVLALAINHGLETNLIAPKIVGLVGWFFLLISGFFGLSLIAEEGGVFTKHAKIIKFQALKKEADEDSLVKTYDSIIKAGKKSLDDDLSKSGREYLAQKWCFYFGVVSLVVSYAYPIVCAIYQKRQAVETALFNLQ